MPSIFLSHTSQDKRFVRKLAANLRLFEVQTWIDEYEILPGDSLIGKIEHGLNNSDYVAVILSPNSVKSEWVNRELRSALAGEISCGKLTVLPVLISDCPIPTFLRDKLYADFRQDFYSGLWSILRRLHSDNTLSGASADYIERWLKKHHKVEPLARFTKFVKSEEQRLAEEAKAKELRARISAMNYEQAMDFISIGSFEDFLAFADFFQCKSECFRCKRLLIDLWKFRKQIRLVYNEEGWTQEAAKVIYNFEDRYFLNDSGICPACLDRIAPL